MRVKHHIKLFFGHTHIDLIGDINESLVHDIRRPLHDADLIFVFYHAQTRNDVADIPNIPT